MAGPNVTRASTRNSTPPEEAPSLDARKSIGDRLLLQTLEYERVVQGRGQQIGQRISNQNILWRERILIPTLNIEHTEQGLAVADGQAEHGA